MICFVQRSNQTTFIIQIARHLVHFITCVPNIWSTERNKQEHVYFQLLILLDSVVWTSIFQVTWKVVQSPIPANAENNTAMVEVGTHQFDVYGSGSGIQRILDQLFDDTGNRRYNLWTSYQSNCWLGQVMKCHSWNVFPKLKKNNNHNQGSTWFLRHCVGALSTVKLPKYNFYQMIMYPQEMYELHIAVGLHREYLTAKFWASYNWSSC